MRVRNPAQVGYYIVSTFNQFNKGYKSEMWEGCIKCFIQEMQDFAKEAMTFYFKEKRLQWDNWVAFTDNQETQFHICDKPFNAKQTDKVRDNDHVTGLYPGGAHKCCNLRLRPNCKISVFFYNLHGYDSDFITIALKDFKGVGIRVIGDGT